MSADAIASVNTPGLVLKAPIMPHLVNNTLDPIALSNDLEKQMRVLIIEHRKVRSLFEMISKIELGFQYF